MVVFHQSGNISINTNLSHKNDWCTPGFEAATSEFVVKDRNDSTTAAVNCYLGTTGEIDQNVFKYRNFFFKS